jgi:hypothetical protein
MMAQIHAYANRLLYSPCRSSTYTSSCLAYLCRILLHQLSLAGHPTRRHLSLQASKPHRLACILERWQESSKRRWRTQVALVRCEEATTRMSGLGRCPATLGIRMRHAVHDSIDIYMYVQQCSNALVYQMTFSSCLHARPALIVWLP